VCVKTTVSVDGLTLVAPPPLRSVRIAQGLSLREAARRAHLDPAHLSRVERGERQLSVDALARLAQVLGLTELSRLLQPYQGQPYQGRASA
jgi:transcriptional regulator with XRE-family HTH domain